MRKTNEQRIQPQSEVLTDGSGLRSGREEPPTHATSVIAAQGLCRVVLCP